MDTASGGANVAAWGAWIGGEKGDMLASPIRSNRDEQDMQDIKPDH
jgi:hypothetical protein